MRIKMKKVSCYCYIKEDEFLKIIQAMIESDVIVFATPVYWYAMSGSMKIFFDRFSDLISLKNFLKEL